MFKKAITALLVVLLSLSMVACAPASETETDAPSSIGTTGTTVAAPTTTVPTTTQTKPTVFEEIVLEENDDITVKITAIERDAIWGYTLKVFLENKTGRELMFTVDDVSVNGFMCDPFWAESVAAGKKSNSSISWLSSSFEENNIQDVKEITFTLRVYDSNDILADDLLEQTFTIHP